MAASSAKQDPAARWLASQGAPGQAWLSCAIAADVGATLASVAQAALLAWAVSRVAIAQVALAQVLPLFVGFAVATVLRGVFRALGQGWATTSARQITGAIRRQIIAHLFTTQQAPPPAETLHTLLEGVEHLTPYFAHYRLVRWRVGIVPLILLGVIIPTNWVAGLLLVLATPMIPIMMSLIGMGARDLSDQQAHVTRRLSAYFLDRVRGVADLRRLGSGAAEHVRVEAASRALGKRSLAVVRLAATSATVLETFSTFGVALVALFIGFALLHYLPFPVHLDLGAGLFLLLLAPTYFAPLRDFAAAYHDQADALAATKHLLPLIAPASSTRLPPQPMVPRRITTLEAKGVSVHYPGMLDAALQEIDLVGRRNAIVGITGPSGVGKSTLLGVLAGQIVPTTGTISLNGRPVDPAQLRSSVAWVGQRPYLFPGTIAENIALGRPDASMAAIMAAARRSGVLDFAATLPQGLGTILHERGSGISAGQAQRVAGTGIFA